MKKSLCFILGIVLILGVLVGINVYLNKDKSDQIQDNYLFVFH